MQLKKYLLKKLPAFAVILFALGLTSCGSYQYVGQDSDGVYGEDAREVEVVQADVNDNGNNVYYKNYFKEKSLEMDSQNNGEIFIDIDSYEGAYSEDEVQVVDANTGYGAWGDNGGEVSINVYNNGFNNWGWNRWNRWNNWGWNQGFGWNAGFGYAGLGYGFGGFYDPFWCPPYAYGFGYGGFPYYGGYYGWNGYGRNSLAFNSTRRGGIYGRNSVLGRRFQTTSRTRTNSTRTRTSTTPRTRSTTPRTRTRSTTPRVRSTTPRTRTRTSTPRTRTPRSSSPRVRTTTPRTRSSSPSRSSTRSSSPSRSSTRSSSGSSRSRSSSGSRRRG